MHLAALTLLFAPLMWILMIAVGAWSAEAFQSLRYRLWQNDVKSGGLDLDDPEVIVTLVHGTWAHKSAWIQPNSLLRHGIRKRLRGRRVAFNVLAWSGGNSLGARDYGATLLSNDLQRLAREHPDAEHVVIAHSHGGNAVLYAFRQAPELASSIRGIAFLATPFLHARLRSLAPYDYKIARLAIVMMYTIAAEALYAVFLLLQTAPPPHVTVVMRIIAIALLVGFVSARAVPRIERRANQWMRLLALPTKALPPTFVARAVGDEAGAALTALFAGSMFGTFAWKYAAGLLYFLGTLADRIETGIRRHRRKIWVAIAVIDGLLAWLFWAVYLEARDRDMIIGGVAIVVMVTLALVSASRAARFASFIARFAGALVLALYSAFVGLLAVPISPGLLFAALYIEIAIEVLPLGQHTMLLRQPPPMNIKRKTTASGLVHSVIYNDAHVVRAIGDWIDTLLVHKAKRTTLALPILDEAGVSEYMTTETRESIEIERVSGVQGIDLSTT